MTSSPESTTMPAKPARPAPEIGATVRTPSGAFAEVIATFPEEGEALVQWSSGDRARFRYAHLRPLPGSDPC